jgi:hypothetical protein
LQRHGRPIRARVDILRRPASWPAGSISIPFLQAVVGGIASGCVYALVALYFVLIYKATEAVSFMQGEPMMSGAFAALAATTFLGLPWWLAVVFSLSVVALLGAGLERFLVRRVPGRAHLAVVMLTLGLGTMLRGLVSLVPAWATQTHALPLPEGFKEAAVWLLPSAMLWRPTCSCAPWSAPARSSMPLPWRAPSKAWRPGGTSSAAPNSGSPQRPPRHAPAAYRPHPRRAPGDAHRISEVAAADGSYM